MRSEKIQVDSKSKASTGPAVTRQGHITAPYKAPAGHAKSSSLSQKTRGSKRTVAAGTSDVTITIAFVLADLC